MKRSCPAVLLASFAAALLIAACGGGAAVDAPATARVAPPVAAHQAEATVPAPGTDFDPAPISPVESAGASRTD